MRGVYLFCFLAAVLFFAGASASHPAYLLMSVDVSTACGCHQVLHVTCLATTT